MASSSAQKSASVQSTSTRDEALRFLIRQAAEAASRNDFNRSDELIGRVLAAQEGSAARSSHDVRMDLLRVSISAVMILGLFGIVAAVAFHPKSSNISPYISLMSGLAGIALGWLFGSGATSTTGVSVSRRQRRGASTQSAQE